MSRRNLLSELIIFKIIRHYILTGKIGYPMIRKKNATLMTSQPLMQIIAKVQKRWGMFKKVVNPVFNDHRIIPKTVAIVHKCPLLACGR
jgi:hypothetical protein